ncbi:MAG: M23 family metallopeptidase [Patescibacteria group bacterium]
MTNKLSSSLTCLLLLFTALPSKADLKLPLESGYAYQVTVGYNGVSIFTNNDGTPYIDTWHQGSYYYALDFDNPSNNLNPKVVAIDSGEVIAAKFAIGPDGYDVGGYGNYVKVRHANGDVSISAHLSRVDVFETQKVVQGEVLGIMGTTGNSSGTHLHFELKNSSGISKIPEPMSGYTNFVAGGVYTSNNTMYPQDNTFIKFDQNNTIFYAFNHRLWDIKDEASFYGMGGDFSKLTIFDFLRYPEITGQYPVMGTIASEGLIARVPTSSTPDRVYKLESKEWRWFKNWDAILYYGYTANHIVDVTQGIFNIFPQSPADLVALDKIFDPMTAKIYKWYHYDYLAVVDQWNRYHGVEDTYQFIQYLQQYTCIPLTTSSFRNFQKPDGSNVTNTGSANMGYQEMLNKAYLEDSGFLSPTYIFWTSKGSYTDRFGLKNYVETMTPLLPLMSPQDRAYQEPMIWEARALLAKPQAKIWPKCN